MAQLPLGVSAIEWTGASYQERLSGSQAPALYAISLLVVFLCLAALYESWSIPFSVMLVVPLGVVGALVATWLRGLENDVYFQVGLLTADRPVGEERDPDRRVRQVMINSKGRELLESTLEASRHAPAADPDDVAGLYSGRAAAGDQQRCRLRQHSMRSALA